ncbi:MAG: hypothetical protein K2X57_28595 [Xanthobacteraceae bacterium]|nr:hypothetical protein [Xanthobacteraceae bacterium]
MTKPWQTQPMKEEAGTRSGKPPHGAVNVRSGPAKMTATLKRRALKKRPEKPAIARPPVIE